MATIPNNPTWVQIRAGMEAARDAYRAAQAQRNAAVAQIKAQRDAATAAESTMRIAMADLQEWEAATRRKLLRGD